MLRSRAALIFALLSVCLAVRCSSPEPAAAPRIVVIGLDGADWEQIDVLLKEDRLPHMESLLEGGTSGVLHTVEPMLSPMLWTSIATGRTPPEHGILDFFATDAEGRKIPVPSHSRRVRALWNIAGDYGHKVAFVGWQVTYPAERVEGFIVSDRVLKLGGSNGARGQPGGITYPASLEQELEARVVSPEAIPDELLARFIPGGVSQSASLRRDLSLVLAHTETVTAIALDLMSREVELLGVYFPGIDEVSHRFARYMPPGLPGVTEQENVMYGGVVEEFYIYQDEIIGEILVAAGPEATIYVVSDHGFRLGRARPRLEPSSKGTPYAAQWHRDNGVILVKGPGIQSGHSLGGASIFDVVPTILAQLNIPPGEDMGGRVLRELWASPPALPVGRVPTHDRPGWREQTFIATREPGEEVRAAEELSSKLRALGYIGEAEEPANADRQTATEYANLAGYYMQQGDLKPALEAAKRSLQEDRGNYTAWRHLATLYRRTGDWTAAIDAIETAISIREDAVEPRLFQVGLLREAGAVEEALRAAESLTQRHSGDVRTHNLLGQHYSGMGSRKRAIQSYRTSLTLDPDQEAITVDLFSILIQQGDAGKISRSVAGPGGVDRWLALGKAYFRHGDLENALHYVERSLIDRPGTKESYLYRGIIIGEQQEYERSVGEFDRALRLDPDYVEAHFNKGVTHLKARNLPGAIESLERAAALLPSSDSILANLGKAYAMNRDYDRAREVLERALRINPESAMARIYWAQVAPY
ncbi:MAG: tetratricopeptide repeat protein [Acidobacteria bacterium]|nr:tetratricopeptide repeat protein [Acidobacteriota bacterium]